MGNKCVNLFHSISLMADLIENFHVKQLDWFPFITEWVHIILEITVRSHCSTLCVPMLWNQTDFLKWYGWIDHNQSLNGHTLIFHLFDTSSACQTFEFDKWLTSLIFTESEVQWITDYEMLFLSNKIHFIILSCRISHFSRMNMRIFVMNKRKFKWDTNCSESFKGGEKQKLYVAINGTGE